MQLFYNSELTDTHTEFTFNKEESKHIVKVLRKKTGDTLHITNGNGVLITAEILLADSKHCKVGIIKSERQNQRPYKLHLAVAPTKMNDRYEWFLEKATEIGIDEITPIICNNSERKIIKLERYQKIVQSAMKQSLQCYLPKLNPAISFSEFIQQPISGQCFIAHCEDTNRKTLKHSLQSQQDTTILIGPEGDFSVKEIETALQHQYIPVTLGNTRLRTETAAVVACHTAALINE